MIDGLTNAANRLYDSISSVAIQYGDTMEDPNYWEFRFHGKTETVSLNTDLLERYPSFQLAYYKTFSHPAPVLRKSSWLRVLIYLSENKLAISECV